MFRKRIALAFLVAAAVAFAGGCRGPNVEGPLAFGAVLPLSGASAAIGTPKREAMELALDDLRSKYGRQLFEVRFEDSRGTPKDGVAALNNAITLGGVKAAFVDMTTIVDAAIPVADDHQILLFAGSAQAGITDRSSNVFRVFPGGEQEIDLVVAHLTSVNAKRVFALHTNELYGRSVLKMLSAKAQAAGIEIAGSEEYPLSETNFRTQLAKAKQSNSDRVVLLGYGIEYAPILRQALESGIPPSSFVSNLGAVNIGVTQLPGELTNGLTFAGPAFALRMSSLDANPEQNRLVTAYRERFKRDPDFRVAFVYDTMMILGQIVSEDSNLANVRTKLLAVRDYPGASGRISIRGNRDAAVDLVLARYESGQIRPLSR